MKRTLLFALALIAAVPVDGVAQDGLDSDTTIREFFDWLGAAVGDLTLGTVIGTVIGTVLALGLVIGAFVLFDMTLGRAIDANVRYAIPSGPRGRSRRIVRQVFRWVGDVVLTVMAWGVTSLVLVTLAGDSEWFSRVGNWVLVILLVPIFLLVKRWCDKKAPHLRPPYPPYTGPDS
jgi:hypothetical protein